MGDRIQLPPDEIKLAFAASCVEGVARQLYRSKTYQQLHDKCTGLYLMSVS